MTTTFSEAVGYLAEASFEEKCPERDKDLATARDLFLSVLKEKTDGPDTLRAASAFLLEILPELPGDLKGPVPDPNLCKALNVGDPEKAAAGLRRGRFSLAERVLEKAAEPGRRHAARRRGIEVAIRRLLVLEKELSAIDGGDSGLLDNVRRALGRAYLFRGLMIRPKGFGVPAGRIEALEKAGSFSAAILNQGPDDAVLRAEVGIESARAGRVPADLEELLGKAAVAIGDRATAHAAVILEGAKRGVGEAKKLLPAIAETGDIPPIIKAGAAALLERWDDAVNLAGKAIDDLPRSFSHPNWDEVTGLIGSLKEGGCPGWKDIARRAWEKCRETELRAGSNLFIRWYWARRRDLYDLAFQAAGNLREQAEVADSLKGRTVLRWEGWSRLTDTTGNERFSGQVEIESGAVLGRYIPGLTEKLGRPAGAGIELEWPQTPEGWAAVHLYLSPAAQDGRDNGKGYAIIHDRSGCRCPGTCACEWRREEFETGPLWETFVDWQENYTEGPSSGRTAIALEALCLRIGNVMAFLFSVPGNAPVVLVPHGFLHRIPLHMAMRQGNGRREIWSREHRCVYAPRWSVISKEKPGTPQGGAVVKKMRAGDERYEHLLESARGSGWQIMQDTEATVGALLSLRNPAAALILCHGVAHPQDPFRSALELEKGRLEIGDVIVDPGLSLSGSRVLLGACESDMMVALSSPVDEHLSLSAMLLAKGAREVLGGLWEVQQADVGDIGEKVVEQIRPGKSAPPLRDTVHEWLKDRIELYIAGGCQPQALDRVAPFRVMADPDALVR